MESIITPEIRERQIRSRMPQSIAATENLQGSRVLAGAKLNREIFDPKNLQHQAAYLVFMRTGNWPIHFHAELPFVTVPATVERKLLEHFLRSARVQAMAEQMIGG